MKKSRVVVLGVVLAAVVHLAPLGGDDTPRELGAVDWGRDFDAALQQSAALGHPVFAFFQEVPGCSTCVSFGEQVLEHPLLVEAIETEFVPVLVYNNRPGRDAALLERFHEPAWNNPVVRFLDGEGRDLIARKSAIWSPHGIGARMESALKAAGRPVPAYLKRATLEAKPHRSELATFGMHCYWSGEACLGGVPGVVATRTGMLAGSEVVEVDFDPTKISYRSLLNEAHSRGCAEQVFARDERQRAVGREVFGDSARQAAGDLREARAGDQRYYLKRSRWKDVSLTSRQAMRVNSAIGLGRDPAGLLSPRQRAEASDG